MLSLYKNATASALPGKLMRSLTSTASQISPHVYSGPELSSHIQRAMEDWSIEVTPQAGAKVKSFTDHLAPGTSVNVTYLPGSDMEDTIAMCERLRLEGMKPIPHIAARSLQSESHFEQYLSQLTERAGIEEVLVIGGGVDNALGPYHESMQVLETGLLQKFGIRSIGLAAHPEGSPDISEDELIVAMRRKNAWAANEISSTNSVVESVYLETQFCFDPSTIISWDKKMSCPDKGAGNKLPIRLGVAGPANIRTLIKFAKMSGVGPSLRVLTKNPMSLVKVATKQSPDVLISGLASYMYVFIIFYFFFVRKFVPNKN